MKEPLFIIPLNNIRRLIYTIRGEQVMLDSDLAEIYGVETKVFNRAVKRNSERFPSAFCFQITQEEYDNLRCQIGTSSFAREFLDGPITQQPVAQLPWGHILSAIPFSPWERAGVRVFGQRPKMKKPRLLSAASGRGRISGVNGAELSPITTPWQA
jgi:hypothetical protein